MAGADGVRFSLGGDSVPFSPGRSGSPDRTAEPVDSFVSSQAPTACGRVHVDASAHPLPQETIDGVRVGDVRSALQGGNLEEALRLTRSLGTAAASGCWQVEEPDGRTYPLLISAGPGLVQGDLMHMLRNGVVMKLALEARKDEPLKQRLREYEAFLRTL